MKYVTAESPVFNLSIKRLAFQTGLPLEDVEQLLGRLMSEGLIVPVGPAGYYVA
jgi:hypothetical protein